MSYPRDQPIRLSVEFRNLAGALVDPTTVTLKVKDNLGVTTTYTWAGATITRDSLGAFHRDVTPATSGAWTYRWVGGGTNAAATSDLSFEVEPSVF